MNRIIQWFLRLTLWLGKLDDKTDMPLVFAGMVIVSVTTCT